MTSSSYPTDYCSLNRFPSFSSPAPGAFPSQGAILDACTVARASKMPYDYCLRMQRHLNAVHILGYIGLSDVYNYDNFFHWFNEEHKLLNEEEVSRVKDIGVDGGTSAHREIVVWLLMFVNEQVPVFVCACCAVVCLCARLPACVCVCVHAPAHVVVWACVCCSRCRCWYSGLGVCS